MNVLKSTSSSYVQTMIENMVFTSYLDNVSVNSKPDHPPGDSHVPIARGLGFRSTFFARGVGVLN